MGVAGEKPIWVGDPGGTSWSAGDVKMSARQTAELGWLLCDGSLRSTTTYAALFNEIGHFYNGGVDPGNGTFRLPDYRDKVPLGASATRLRGATGGAETHTLAAVESGIPAHNHGGSTGGQSISHTHPAPGGSFAVSDGFAFAVSGAGTVFAGNLANQPNTGSASDDHVHAVPSQSASAAASAHNNMQPYQALNFFIKT